MAGKSTRRREPFGKVEPFKMKQKDKPPVRQTRGGRYSGPGTPKMREEFEGTLAAERREAEAKARRAEDPAPRSPRGSSKVAVGRRLEPKAMKGLDRRFRRFLRLGTANPRQVLMLELVAVLTIVTVDSFAHKQAPSPRQYVAPFVVYLILGFAAELGGDGAARVATGIGALVLVALVLVNAPGIVQAIGVASGQRRTPVEGVA